MAFAANKFSGILFGNQPRHVVKKADVSKHISILIIRKHVCGDQEDPYILELRVHKAKFCIFQVIIIDFVRKTEQNHE